MFKAKKRRALSSVVTSAILLSAVSIVGVGMIGWVNTTLTTHQTELDGIFAVNHNKINENIFIEHVWFEDVGSAVNITMSNTGTVGLNVTEIKIQNMNSGQTYTYEKTDAGIVQGGEISFNQTMSPDWRTGTPYDIFVTTDRGNIFRTEVFSQEIFPKITDNLDATTVSIGEGDSATVRGDFSLPIDLAVVIIYIDDVTEGSFVSITDEDTNTWILRNTVVNENQELRVYTATSPTANADNTITVAFSAPTDYGLDVTSYNGINTVTPLVSSAGATSDVGSTATGGINLRTAGSYGLLGSVVNLINPVVIKGDNGGGTQTPIASGVTGESNIGNTQYTQASSDLAVAFNDAKIRIPDTSFGAAKELGGTTVTPGIHHIAGAVSLATNLTFDGEGIYIYQITGAFNSAASSTMTLINGARTEDIFWIITGAPTLGAGSQFSGTLLSLGAINMGTDIAIDGRVLTTGGFLMGTATITVPFLPPSVPFTPINTDSLLIFGYGQSVDSNVPPLFGTDQLDRGTGTQSGIEAISFGSSSEIDDASGLNTQTVTLSKISDWLASVIEVTIR